MPEALLGDVDRIGWAGQVVRSVPQIISRDRWTMLCLVYSDGLRQREVAEQMHLPESVVRREIARSLQLVSQVVSTAV